MATNSASRLGVNGLNEVKAHPFFQAVDWDALGAQDMPAPGWEGLKTVVCGWSLILLHTTKAGADPPCPCWLLHTQVEEGLKIAESDSPSTSNAGGE